MQRLIRGVETRAARVVSGDELAVMGVMSGQVDVAGTLWVDLEGRVAGPVTVHDGGRVLVDGMLAGPVVVERGGDLLVTAIGSSLGPLSNYGSVRVAGAIGSSTSGLPPVLVASGKIVQEDAGKEGTTSHGVTR
jgi:hypothetical protein